MRSLAIIIAVALGVTPAVITAPSNMGGTAQIAAAAAGGGRGGGGGGRGGGGGGGGGGFNLNNDVPATRPTRPPSSGNGSSNGNRGFNLSNDAPASRTSNNTNATNRVNNTDVNNRVNNANVNNHNNTNTNRNINNANVNRNVNNTNIDRNVNNTNVNRNVNVNGGNVNVNRNVNVNGYGYRGPVVVNPVYRGPAWGWNHGVVWSPAPAYWGGGFWGAFAVGAASAIVMGSIVNAANHQTYTSYQVNAGSPGAQLLSNYHLQQVPCGPPNLVVIYGPNNGVICANPNDLVSPGNYAVNADTLTLQSP